MNTKRLILSVLGYLALGVVVVGVRWSWREHTSNRVDGAQIPAPSWQSVVWWIAGVRR
jgi:hypothetical protein|tara:strand:+ start:194 stop:367 length:174 start_codon:yes stop_codon:yes gene_type:complete